jgi:hypothetical protein
MKKGDVSSGGNMPRERLYRNGAERQAAYRARHREREPPLSGELAGLSRSLHGWLAAAVRRGVSPWPAELYHRRSDETMRNLVRYLRGIVEASEGATAAAPAVSAAEGGEG